MNEQETENTFNPKEFVDSLIADMDMQDEDPEKVEQMRSSIEQQMTHVISNTASLNLDPEVFDYVLERYGDVENPTQFFIQVIKHDPEAQVAILNALDKFREQILGAFGKLNKG